MGRGWGGEHEHPPLNVVLPILPRCLFLETADRQEGRGTVVVGINPGRSGEAEQKFYCEHGQTYEQTVAYWNEYLKEHNPYYTKLRTFIDHFNLPGPILWTEIVKCESLDKIKHVPLQTIRCCTNLYLQKKLQAVPDWPLIAVGRDAFFALAYQFPDRLVLGIPHVTRSRGHFTKHFDPLDKGKRLIIVDLLAKPSREAIWITDEFRHAMG